jgi:hypothetical protein
MRKRDIPRSQGFSFGWDDDANMHVFIGMAGETKEMAKVEALKQEAASIMLPNRSYTYSDLVSLIGNKLDVTKRTAERKIAKFECEGAIFKTSVGAYMLEAEGVRLFNRIDGDYFTILGLPLLPLLSYLATRGFIPA